jgi:hypothetical protein
MMTTMIVSLKRKCRIASTSSRRSIMSMKLTRIVRFPISSLTSLGISRRILMMMIARTENLLLAAPAFPEYKHRSFSGGNTQDKIVSYSVWVG